MYKGILIFIHCDVIILYDKIGFNFIHYSSPNYFYVIGNERKNRFGFRKSNLVKNGGDKNLSEHQIMLNKEIYRVYDCGTMKYIWDK